MPDDIVTRLRQPGRNGGVCYCDDVVYGPCADCKERNEAADEIERLRAEAVAFTVRPDEVLVVVLAEGTSPDAVEAWRDRCTALHGRIIFIGDMEARRAEK